MGPKQLLCLRLLKDNPTGLYASQVSFLSQGKVVRGSLYTTLKRLAEMGLVETSRDSATFNYQMERTRYRISAKGKFEYKAFLTTHGLVEDQNQSG